MHSIFGGKMRSFSIALLRSVQRHRVATLMAASALLLSGCALAPLLQAPGAILSGIALLLGVAACSGGGGGGGGGSTGTTPKPPEPSHWPAVVGMSLLNNNPTLGIVLQGPTSSISYSTGFSIAAGPSVTGDSSHSDLVIGEPNQLVCTHHGMVWVVFGGSALTTFAGTTGIADLNTSNLGSAPGSFGFHLQTTGFGQYDGFGTAVGLASLNGDAAGDVIVGEPGRQNGQAWVVFGNSSAAGILAGDIGPALSPTFASSQGFLLKNDATFGGVNVSQFGTAIATVDLNGDKFADLIGAAPNGFSGNGPALFVTAGGSQINGTSAVNTIGTSTANVTITGAYGSLAGKSLAPAGDVNHDGFADLIVGAPNVGGNYGAAFVVFGNSNLSSSGFPSQLSSTLTIAGYSVWYAGTVVAGIGDVNGDKIDDMLVIAPDHSGSGAAKAFVVFGNSNLSSGGSIALNTLGSAGFGIALPDDAVPNAAIGADVNGDGINDIIIGSKRVSVDGLSDVGAVFVIFGASSLTSVGTFDASTLDGSNGFRAVGPSAYAYVGSSFSVGDLNGDGIKDIVIGAPDAFTIPVSTQVHQGKVYVIYGLPAGGTFPSTTQPGIVTVPPPS